MRSVAAISIVASVLHLVVAAAADNPSFDGALEAAKEAYEKEAARIAASLTAAEQLADQKRTMAKQKLVKAYEDAIKRSTQRGDLVTANAILEEKSAIEEDLPAPVDDDDVTKNSKITRMSIEQWMANSAGWKTLARLARANVSEPIDGNLDTQNSFPPGNDLDITIKEPITASAIAILTRDQGSADDVFVKASLIINDTSYEIANLRQQTCHIIALPKKVKIRKIRWITQQQSWNPGIREVMFR